MNSSPLQKITTAKKWVTGVLLLIAVTVVYLVSAHVIDLTPSSLIPIGLLIMFAVGGYWFYVTSITQKTKQIIEFSRVHLATIEALATAIDARDQVGLGHVRRTQIYAVGIGKLMNLPDSDIDALRTGALLHDIGKLAVPDHILNKPGKLTAAEIEKTKIHPMVGASILEKVGFDYPVVPTVKYHHENWDGRGYPEGLQGNDIPLTARILCVADAYDTLRGARPYRPPIAREEARQIILDGSGTRFDPAIVQILLCQLTALEDDIKAHGLAYADPAATESSTAPGKVHGYVEQIKLANREVFSLYELAREFSASASLHATLELFAKKVGEFVPYDTCALYLMDDITGFASAAHVQGENADILSMRAVKVGQGATGFALKSGEPVLNADPDLDFAYSQAELTGLYQTMASLPLVADGELLGAVTIYSSSLDSYGEEHIRLLETITRIAADAIGKSLEHDEAKTHSLTDPMTGLPNARSLQIQFEREVGRASRGGTNFQLLMLDLDGFKAVNDTFGHKVGDQILKEVGQVILGQLRDYDFLARYGGDEFVALVPDADANDVIELCDRIERAVTEFALYIDDKRSASVGVSLGASGYPKKGETFDQMIVAADKAMYIRKTNRKRLATITNVAGKTLASNSQDQDLNSPLSTIHYPLSSDDAFIVELDESHVLATSSVN